MLRTMLELGYGDSNLGEQLPRKISPPPQAGAYQKLCFCQERAVSGDLVVQQARQQDKAFHFGCGLHGPML